MGAADRIAEVILRQGEIAGRGAQNNGAIWGGALQNLGQQITALPTYVQNQRMREQETAMRDQEMQMRGMALQQQQRGVADQQSLDDAMRAGVVQDANGNYVADRQKVSSYLLQRAPHLLPTIQKHWADADETDIKRREAQGKLNDAEVEDVARLATTGLTGLEHGLSAEDSAALILPDINAHGMSGIIDPESHKRLVAQLDAAKGDPQAMKTLLEGWRNKSKAQSEAYSARALAEKREQPAQPKSDLLTNENELIQDAATLGTSAESPTAWRSAEAWRQIQEAKNKAPSAEPTVTIRTTDKNGRPIERVMTRSQALAEGQFPSQPRAAQGGGGTSTEATNAQDIAEAIIQGKQPPELTGLYRMAGPVRAELARRGYNQSQALTDWRATQAHVRMLNSNQQGKLNQSINALPELLDSVDELADQWKGGRFPVLNSANLALAKGGTYGPEVATIANQISTQIADVVGDLATVYMGGNSPTDEGIKLAKTALSADWDRKVLKDMVAMAKKNVQIRRNSILNTGVAGASPDNQYAPPVPAAAPPPAGGAVPSYQDYLKAKGKK